MGERLLCKSGKIRRTELRATEAERRRLGQRGEWEFFESDFPDLEERRWHPPPSGPPAP